MRIGKTVLGSPRHARSSVTLQHGSDKQQYSCPGLSERRTLQNLAAWATAGVIVYYVWVKPEQDAAAARKVCSGHIFVWQLPQN